MASTHATRTEALKLAALSGLTYMTVYGFRKPWRACTFPSMSTKGAIGVAQTAGYGLGKFIGVGMVSGIPRTRILSALILCAAAGTLQWLVLGLMPEVVSFIAIAAGAAPIACTWSLVYRLVEGRDSSSYVGAALGASLVVSSGIAKLVAQGVLSIGVSPWWTPLATAMLYLPCFLWLARQLASMPGQTAKEVAVYGSKEAPASRGQSACGALSRHAGLVCLLAVPSVFATALRDLRDTFQADILQEGTHAAQGVGFVASELAALVATVWLLPAVMQVEAGPRFLQRTMRRLHLVMGGISALAALASALTIAGWLSLRTWYSMVGVSVYLLYVPLAGLYCDRLFSALGEQGSAAVLMQALEAAGYAGSLVTMATVVGSLDNPNSGSAIASSMLNFGLYGGLAGLACIAVAAVMVEANTVEADTHKESAPVRPDWRSTARAVSLPAACVALSIWLYGRGVAGVATRRFEPSLPFAGRTFYVDIDNTLADAWGRFRDNTIPQWPGEKMSTLAFLQDAYGADPPIKGGREVLRALREQGGRVVILTARAQYENATAASRAWLQQHDITYDEFVLVRTPSDKLETMRSAGCSPASCVIIDDFARVHQAALPMLATEALCRIAGHWNEEGALRSGAAVGTVELFDLHHNNWQGIASRYTPWLVGVEPAVTPALKVTLYSATYQQIMMDRAMSYGLRLTDGLDWDAAWLTKQNPGNIQHSAAEAGLVPSPDHAGPWQLQGGSHQRPNAVPGVTHLVNTKAVFCGILHEAGLVGTPGFRPCFSVPDQATDALAAARARPKGVWVYKPNTSSNGNGVKVLMSTDLLAQPELLQEAAVVQEYVSDPVLHQGRKTDVRFYVLVPSFDPLRVYVHRQGYVRVAGSPYTLSAFDPVIHVTNSHDNPSSTRLQYWDEFADLLRRQGLDPERVWAKAAAVASKAVRAVAAKLGCLSSQPALRYYPCGAAFQQFGMDAVVDSDGEVWLLELNPDPSLKYRNDAIAADDVERDRDILRITGIVKPATGEWQQTAAASLRQACATEGWRVADYTAAVEQALSGNFMLQA